MSESEHPDKPGEPSGFLVTAIRKILRPLVRLMLSQQITYPFLINHLKSLYVEVAESEFDVPGKRQSDSRITLLTGVHRKDVKRLRSEDSEQPLIAKTTSLGAQVIAWWMGSPQYCHDDGSPKALPLRASASGKGDPDGAYFDDLVTEVCRQDIRPRVILDEWLRLGIAHQDDQERVVLNTGAFTPDEGFEEKVFFFGKNIQDHIDAGAQNLMGIKPAHFDRSVYYDKLSTESIEELRELANEIGMQALIRMNSQALALQQRDATHTKSESEAKYRMNFGIFHYNDRHNQNTGDEQNG